MSNFDEKLNELNRRLENLVKYQEYFYREIHLLHQEIESLKTNAQSRKVETEQTFNESPPTREYVSPRQYSNPESQSETSPHQAEQQNARSASYSDYKTEYSPSQEQSNIEKFIGQNLISIVGIVVTIIGVAIGAKYAIDNNLISPLVRIILGYAFSIGLFALAIRLKPKYHDFSAVLMSGAMAIMYFITYFAYGFYGLIPQPIAFLLMLFFTVFAVGAAINYNRQVIAHIGLVGAYAVPFLIGGNSSNAAILFGYVAVINLGILGVSLKTYWKSLFYSSFVFTWLIYAAWHLTKYNAASDFALAFTFLTIFFLIFYATFIGYKLIAKEDLSVENAGLVLVNSFTFYGFGYALIQSQPGGSPFLGLFTLINALTHFAVNWFVHRYTHADKNVNNFLITLALIFITITIPVQLRGNWIALLWTAEAALLFWLGRTKNMSIYEYFSYPLMVLASLAILVEWGIVYDNRLQFRSGTAQFPLFNPTFLVSIIYVAAFVFIDFINRSRKPASESSLYQITSFAFPAIFLLALYNTFRMEIGNYWHYRLVNGAVQTSSLIYDNDLHLFNIISQIDYSILFLVILSLVNIRKVKSPVLGYINIALNALMLMIFLAGGLFVLSLLRESYLSQANAEFFNRGVFHILIRYISLAFVAALIVVSYEYIKQEFLHRFVEEEKLRLAFDFGLHLSVLWLASSELLNLTNILSIGNADKLGLSILWGFYSLFLIVLGINRNKKHLRYWAIGLFAATLFKVFFYDIAELDTISKTVVFVSLGILLLIISFLYNKYKDLIFEQNEI